MNPWVDVKDKQPEENGLYLVQTRQGLAHLEVNYTLSYWNGWKWYNPRGEHTYYWQHVNQAPEPESVFYIDGMDRMPCVMAQELVGELNTPLVTPK